MKERWRRLPDWQKITLCCAAALLCILGIWGLFQLGGNRVSQGRTWIQEQSQKDPAEISQSLADRRMTELKQAYAEGKVSYSALLPDYAMLGDSRAAGFAEYGILDQNRSLAVIGTDVQDIPNRIEQVQALQPANLIFSYGVNDIEHNLGNGPEGYAQVYEDYIKQVVAVDPTARVYVTSILDVSQDVVNEIPQFENLAAYNEQLKQMCERNKWIFIDAQDLNSQAQQSFESDGIHFTPDFYVLWAEKIVDSVGEAS